MIQLDHYSMQHPLILAPMAGVSDVPFRELCLAQGADLAVAEMLSSNVRQWSSRKNRDRLRRANHTPLEIVQIAGSDPDMMAEAAIANAATGAEVIDINMGCPAKKVLQRAAGSALLRDPDLVERILKAVIRAVDVPVTLKIRTGWSRDYRNGIEIAHIAEQAGVRMLSVHGRTRECRFKGEAEYDTIAAIKQAISIPVIANGDIDSPRKAAHVLRHTGADGLMIGRSAQGQPWLFRAIRHHLETGQELPPVDALERAGVALDHVQRIHAFYDPQKALVFARKHLSWYSHHLPDGRDLKCRFNVLESLQAQIDCLQRYGDDLETGTIDRTLADKELAA